ncbi:unnamed protein product [Prorocentrum cordatum]|uniref:Uncharacterized protein n=1 Tax=Prorocentrum cordatum TaxID=2364126 RepID=A0ABN9PC37_9DINO|nr:unnamed protein product [Polarella glacialis]
MHRWCIAGATSMHRRCIGDVARSSDPVYSDPTKRPLGTCWTSSGRRGPGACCRLSTAPASTLGSCVPHWSRRASIRARWRCAASVRAAPRSSRSWICSAARRPPMLYDESSEPKRPLNTTLFFEARKLGGGDALGARKPAGPRGTWTFELAGVKYTHGWGRTVVAGYSDEEWSITSAGWCGFRRQRQLWLTGSASGHAAKLCCANQDVRVLSSAFAPSVGRVEL